ncbi:RHS repeat-associated core domain-containing protein [Rubellicoccus peritrichatus]|uniref:RHS repeat-associated core domain-containing protein n=1 Tax=Rubellicoccus peritrichatus TaxID=3080537 RepID=A0AAQ3LAG6_9BACT|nr:RHS repeat-associated core domain-containing protein [Puniceicoccus sp. CR14]WOO42584.1 RHS repeat-associated core domain-containing protein [Puniceicoccus sp. CR14]
MPHKTYLQNASAHGPSGEVLTNSASAGTLFVPQTPLVPTYDDDGNLTQDGRWSYSWNAENRLIEQDTLASAVTAGAEDYRVTYQYDYLGRMFERVVYKDDVVESTERFIWDGYNQVAKVDGLGNLLQTYLWGLDLSGTLQDAGGVGGLLSVTDSTGTSDETFLAFYDGNGNIMGYADASDGSIAANFDYGPFGESLRESGDDVGKLDFRFSTKISDSITGIIHYELRDYNPESGRWLSRDPIEENGGLNLYGFVGNDGTNNVDILGLSITINIGYDSEGTKVRSRLERMTVALDEVLRKCKENFGLDVEYDINEVGTDIVKTPLLRGFGRVGNRINDYGYDFVGQFKNRYNMTDSEYSRSRYNEAITIIQRAGDGVPVLLTAGTIRVADGIAEGVAFDNQSILINLDPTNGTLNRYVLAHELGHYAGYVPPSEFLADDGHHYSESTNLMHGPAGSEPDCGYCIALWALSTEEE